MRNIKLIEDLPFEVPEIEDITDVLPKKQTWDELPKHYIHHGKDLGYMHTGPRNAEDIDTIVIHHSGSPEGTLQSHALYHMRKWGAGISYHLAIDNGRIYQVNSLLTFTFHVGNHNTHTIGICVNRDLSKGDMTSQERELLYASILTVKSLLPIQAIKGHNELNATSCPCTSMNKIREDIVNLEMEMAYRKSGLYHTEEAFSVVSRIVGLQETLSEKGQYSPEAQRKLLEIGRFMRDKGWVQ